MLTCGFDPSSGINYVAAPTNQLTCIGGVWGAGQQVPTCVVQPGGNGRRLSDTAVELDGGR